METRLIPTQFIATRSKRKALRLTTLPHPIAVKVHGGYLVYSAY